MACIYKTLLLQRVCTAYIVFIGLLARAAEIGNWGVERIYPWSCRVGAELNFVSALQELSGVWVFASAEALGQGKSLMGAS